MCWTQKYTKILIREVCKQVRTEVCVSLVYWRGKRIDALLQSDAINFVLTLKSIPRFGSILLALPFIFPGG